MKFLYQDLGYRQAGEEIEITLKYAANVRLLGCVDISFQPYESADKV